MQGATVTFTLGSAGRRERGGCRRSSDAGRELRRRQRPGNRDDRRLRGSRARRGSAPTQRPDDSRPPRPRAVPPASPASRSTTSLASRRSSPPRAHTRVNRRPWAPITSAARGRGARRERQAAPGRTVTFTLGAGAGAGGGAGAASVGGGKLRRRQQPRRPRRRTRPASQPRRGSTANTTAGTFTATATAAGTRERRELRRCATWPASRQRSPPGLAATESTTAGRRFPIRLAVTVTDRHDNPVAGVLVTFSAPAAGASGTLPGAGTHGERADERPGIAVAPAFTADSHPPAATS